MNPLGPSNLKTIEYRKTLDTIVLDDFPQILDGIYIFKQFFGDLDIPAKFEVPAEEPWPSPLHGLRLGRRLEKLFTSPEFFMDYPEKVQEIANLGLKPSIDSLIDDWTVTVKALIAYKEIYGSLQISTKFVIPDEDPWPRVCRNLKLGQRITQIRSTGRFIRNRSDRRNFLNDIGFEWKVRDHTHKQQIVDDLFDQIYDALVIYKNNINSNLTVPNDYIIPVKDIWPAELHGLKLGELLRSTVSEDKLSMQHPDRLQKLNELGYVWEHKPMNLRETQTQQKFDQIVFCLKRYKELYGTLDVPSKFVVPNESSDWPQEVWNFKLGNRVMAIRNDGAYVQSSLARRETLDSLGFDWKIVENVRGRKKSLDTILDGPSGALSDLEGKFLSKIQRNDQMNSKALRNINVDPMDSPPFDMNLDDFTDEFDMDSAFNKIPDEKNRNQSDQEFLEEGEDMLLRALNALPAFDNKVARVKPRVQKEFPSTLSIPVKQQSPSTKPYYDPGIMFAPPKFREVAAEAMLKYLRELEASEDPSIIQTSHFEGYLSPETLNAMIARVIRDDEMKKIMALRHRIMDFGPYTWEVVMEAFRIYASIYGDLNIPIEFCVTDDMISDAKNVPTFMTKHVGMELGEYMESIRIGDVDGYEDPIRRKELNELGFPWGPNFKLKYQRYRFIPTVLGLKIYRYIYGHAIPQTSFVVPPTKLWPYWMHDMPLGEWSTVIRVQQSMIFKYYPHRYEILTSMAFKWWIPPGASLPEKYYEPLN